jgi:methyl-accepting chemotaxis protein
VPDPPGGTDTGGSREVTAKIHEVNEQAVQTGSAATQVGEGAKELSNHSVEMNDVVCNFLMELNVD